MHLTSFLGFVGKCLQIIHATNQWTDDNSVVHQKLLATDEYVLIKLHCSFTVSI